MTMPEKTPSKTGWWVDEKDRINSPKFSPRKGKKIKLIVVHTTVAPRETLDNRGRIERWFKNTSSTASSHFVILRDGTILQGVSTDDAAWHAGKSKWPRQGVNGESVNLWSIGIDLDTLGRLKTKDGQCFDAYGSPYKGTPVELNGNYFDPFTDEQIASATKLIAKLANFYHIDAADIVGHCDVSPGRKTDPEPLFPWAQALSGLEEPDLCERTCRWCENQWTNKS